MSKQVKRILALLLCLCLCMQYAWAFDTTTAGENTSGAQTVTETESAADTASGSTSAQGTTETDPEGDGTGSDPATIPDADLSSPQQDGETTSAQPDSGTGEAGQSAASSPDQGTEPTEDGTEAPATDLTPDQAENAAQQEEGSDLQQEDPAQQETEDSESPLLSYAVVNTPQLSTPDTQEILIGIGDETTLLEQAVLTVRNEATGATASYEAAQLVSGAALFRIEYGPEQSGTYTLESVQIVWNGVTSELLFSDAGITARYGVDTSVDTDPDGVVTEEGDSTGSTGEQADVVFDVTTMGQGGEQVLADSIEDALNNADLEQGIATMSLDDTKDGNVVIVLDPGHDDTHKGTYTTVNGTTYWEQDLNLKIAQYCKQELEQYEGVTVYMTRTSNACPNIKSGETAKDVNATLCNQRRVEYAASVGADYLVSIHLNSADTPDEGTGAEVYYPNQNYDSELSESGLDLANDILEQLADLGLSNRGAKIRNSEDNTTYPDGSLADYYGIIRRCKEAGICGIIVEHAFLTNSSDFEQYLSSDAKLQALGVADATGIANYLGLTKESADLSNAKLSVTRTESGTLTASLTGITGSIQGAQFAVWSEENGQDDLVWYSAQRQSDGTLTATIPLSEHSGYGTYNIHCYVQTASGNYLVDNTFITVSQVTGSASTEVIDPATGSFRVYISDLGSADLISRMQVAVWSGANGQDDLIWTDATKDGDRWYVDVDTYDHDYEQGLYNIHIYLQDTMGGYYFIDGIEHTVTQEDNAPSVSTQWDQADAQLNLTLKNYLMSKDVTSVSFAVWSDEDGQDDLVWYTAQRQDDGTLTAAVPLSDHASYGTYNIHCYSFTDSGNRLVAYTSAAIDQVTGTVTAAVTNTTTGSFRVTISDVNLPDAVDEVNIAVWSGANGQDDLIWTEATRDGDEWYLDVDTYDHDYEQGVYNIHVYLQDTMGGYYFIDGIEHIVAQEGNAPSVSTQWDQADAQLNLTLTDYLMSKNVTSVSFAVWSDEDGQDDLVWYTAQRQDDGTLTAAVPLSDHASYGSYNIHCYSFTDSGNQLVAYTSAAIDQVTGTVTAAVTNTTTGAFRVTISDVNLPDAVDEISIAVWSGANGQDDLIWTEATRDGDEWYLDVDTYDHNYEQGVYNIHVYLRDTMGGYYFIDGIEHTVTQQISDPSVSTQWDQANAQLNLTLTDYLMSKNVTSVSFAVWSDEDGQDDLVWYSAQRQDDGTLTAAVPLSDHASYGIYNIHCYAFTNSGNQLVAYTSTSIDRVTGTASVVTLDSLSGDFRVDFSNVTPVAAVKEVQVAVWSAANGQDDLIWYTADKTSSGWSVNVDTQDHHYESGIYNIHIYVLDAMGGKYIPDYLSYTVHVNQESAKLTVAMNSDTDYLGITLSGTYLDPETSVVKFAVWSANNGQDDLIWYTATYNSGKWNYSVPLANHRFDTGVYNIHCYYDAGDGEKLLRTATITPYSGARPGNTATAKTIWDFLVGKGMTEEGAAALMGNLFAESGLNSSNLQNGYEVSLGYTDASYTSAVDNGSYRYKTYTDARSSFSRDSAGYGLIQWTYWSRKQALYDFCQSSGTSIGDLNMQLNFLWAELNTAEYSTVLRTLTTATSVKTATDVVLTKYARPADQSAAVAEMRANYGRAYYSYFAQ